MTVDASSETLRIAVEFARNLERLRIPYLLGGSLASAVHGEPRATLDADFAVHMTPELAVELAEALKGDYHVQSELLVAAAEEKRVANVFHKKPFVKVDIHVRDASGHSLEEMRRAEPLAIGAAGEASLRIATAEDVVLQKLRWFRARGEVSDRQWRDVVGILKRRAGKMDREYLARWASELEVEDLLERAERAAFGS